MVIITAIILALLFLVLSGFHWCWAFGWGIGLTRISVVPERQNSNGAKTFKPRPLETIAVALGLMGFASVVLLRANIVQFGAPFSILSVWSAYGIWAIVAIFLLRSIGEFKYVGLFKSVRTTNFAYWDTRLFTPLCLVISLLSVIIAIQ